MARPEKVILSLRSDEALLVCDVCCLALLEDGISGRLFRAQDYAGMSLADALALGATIKP